MVAVSAARKDPEVIAHQVGAQPQHAPVRARSRHHPLRLADRSQQIEESGSFDSEQVRVVGGGRHRWCHGRQSSRTWPPAEVTLRDSGAMTRRSGRAGRTP